MGGHYIKISPPARARPKTNPRGAGAIFFAILGLFEQNPPLFHARGRCGTEVLRGSSRRGAARSRDSTRQGLNHGRVLRHRVLYHWAACGRGRPPHTPAAAPAATRAPSLSPSPRTSGQPRPSGQPPTRWQSQLSPRPEFPPHTGGTVAILAQGTIWAVAAMLRFCLLSSDPVSPTA